MATDNQAPLPPLSLSASVTFIAEVDVMFLLWQKKKQFAHHKLSTGIPSAVFLRSSIVDWFKDYGADSPKV